MYQFNDLSKGNERALADSVNGEAIIEPLGGPLDVDDIMGRFPDSIYQQGRDTHLYHFLQALCGDAGAGMLKKQTYAARLLNEAQSITFNELDSFYGNQFRFARLCDEVHAFDTDVENLTEEEWEEERKKDDAFNHRIHDFLNATRLGNSPDGMEYAARAGSGIDAEIVEHYKYIYDLYSDDPLGLLPAGKSNSVHEFVINTHIYDQPDGDVANQKPNPDKTIASPIRRYVTFDTDTFNISIVRTNKQTVNQTLTRIVPIINWETSAGMDLDDEETFDFHFLRPDLERNMIDVVDRLRPVGALLTVEPNQRQYIPINLLDEQPMATSERIFVIRYVNGTSAVEWPDPDNEQGTFIVADEEREMRHAGNARELPVIFQTIEGVLAYTNQPITDSVEPTYNTEAFYLNINDAPNTAPYYSWESEHVGQYHKTYRSIFPIVKTIPAGDRFRWDVQRAIAINNTPLILEGRV